MTQASLASSAAANIIHTHSYSLVDLLPYIKAGKARQASLRESDKTLCVLHVLVCESGQQLWTDSLHVDRHSVGLTLRHLDCVHPDQSSVFVVPPAQAFVIAVTSDFIPRLVYQYSYSHNGTLHGFVNHTLSFFNVSQLKEGTQPENSQFDQEVQFCR